jgi:hypothetical protein
VHADAAFGNERRSDYSHHKRSGEKENNSPCVSLSLSSRSFTQSLCLCLSLSLRNTMICRDRLGPNVAKNSKACVEYSKQDRIFDASVETVVNAWHTYGACLPTCPPACSLACLPARLLAR